jgi:hypothetical protein
MASNEDQFVADSGIFYSNPAERGGNRCLKCIEMKTELINLRNELKSAQLVVRLLQKERNNQLSDQVNFHNLTNSVDEERNLSQLAVSENNREWKQVLKSKDTPYMNNKNHQICKQQYIPVVVTMNRFEQLSDNQGRFNSIQFNLFHPRIIIHDMGQVKD